MKQKLILLQPKQYNELFSSYHSNKRNFNINSRVNLPKISINFPKEWETASSTSRINNTSSTLYQTNQHFSSKKNSYIFDKNKDFFYPTVTQTMGSMTTRTSDFLPYPSITQHYKKIIDYKSKDKKKFNKTKSDLKMIYLNLIKGDKNENKNNYKIESFLKDYDENEKIRNDIIINKINEMNKQNKKKIDNIFNKVELSKIRNDMAMIENIPVILINFYAQDIYNNYYNSTNKEILNLKKTNKLSNSDIDNNNNLESLITNFKKNMIQRNKYVNNVFFKYILDNVKHKIEIINQNNKHITMIYVKNLINSEIKYFQKEISNYKNQYNTNTSQFTGNNTSRITNYETSSKYTFKYRTNNSSIKDNENASTNNNSSLIGNLIKKNIYSKKNGGKKRKFETTNIFHKVDPNTFFQNKEIISSIKKKDKIEEYKNKGSNKKNDSDNEDKTKDKFNLTTNSFDHAAHKKIKSKLFQRDESQKKLERRFSDVYLNKRYKKPSEFITAISNDIERRFRLKHKDSLNDYYYDSSSYTNKDKKGMIKNIKKGKYKNGYNNNYNRENSNDDNDNDKESFLITPIKDKQSIGVNTDYKGNKINFKNEEMRNNYEGIINTLSTIKENNKNKYYFTPDKMNSKETKYINKGTEKDILFKVNDENNANNKKNKNGKEKKNQKMDRNKLNNKNTDLKSIKISKNTSIKDLDRNSSKNNNNKRSSNASIKGAKKLYNHHKIKDNDNNEEESEDEEYEEEDDDEEDEEEEDEEDEFLTEKERLVKKIIKKMKMKKNKNVDDGLKDDENIKQEENKNNPKDKSSRRNSLIGLLTKKKGTNSNKSIKNEKNGNNEKNEKGLKVSDSQKNMSNSSKRKSTINKDVEEEDEEFDELEDFDDPELLKEMQKYNLDKKEFSKLLLQLRKDKKNKRKGGFADKFHKGSKDTDEEFILKEKEIENISGEKRNDANFDRDEEIKILKEIEELDEALTLDEKQFMIKEMIELRNLIVKVPKKTKEIRDKINEKRLALFEIIDKFFINWIIKDLALKTINVNKYKHKLDLLIYIQNYRIYSIRNLRVLEAKYIKPYIEEENRRKKEEEKKREKSLRKKITDEEFKRFKKLVEAKKRNKDLIFDNSYLFKKDKVKKFKLRKEVEEILNTDYGLNYHGKSGSKSRGKKKKKSKKKGRNKLVKITKSSFFNNVELTKEEIDEEERRQRLIRELEEKEKMEEIRDKRLYDFFSRIQRLKNGKIKNFEEELNLLIDEQIDEADRIRVRKETRMNYFLQEFQLNRVKAKYNSDYRNKKFEYLSPIIFTSENKK